MKKLEKKYIYPSECVKIKSDAVDLVRDNKDKTGVPIGVFIEQCIREKLGKK